MASTNKTTHYELSQYVGTDKPTYLTDYNQDMSRIDAGIYGAKSLADVNESAIGTLANLSTTAKTDLVSAINEVDGEVATNTANISTNTSNISTNSTNIGNLSNLTTASKTNLVSAINEVDANSDSNSSAIGNLANLETTAKSNLVSAINEISDYLNVNTYNSYSSSDIQVTVENETGTITVSSDSHISVATNNDKSLAKIYGALVLGVASNHIQSNKYYIKLNVDTGLRPSQRIDVNPLAIMGYSGDGTQYPITARINTDGTIEFGYSFTNDLVGANTTIRINIFPCLLFIKDFGDVPSI